MNVKEFNEAWNKLPPRQRKFVLAYLETLDAREAARKAGYNEQWCNFPRQRLLRKVSHVIDYLMEKNNIINNIVRPEFVLNEFIKIYDASPSEITKTNVLKELSKILNMQRPETKVEVNNNIPTQPVEITFIEEGNDE
jgi:phage terminase small subunit